MFEAQVQIPYQIVELMDFRKIVRDRSSVEEGQGVEVPVRVQVMQAMIIMVQIQILLWVLEILPE